MTTSGVHPDIIVYLCKNCIPGGKYLPVQWSESGLHIRVKEIPCSGKIEAQYILHALEGGLRGVCVATCPQGDCTLSQGNYRAEMRINTVKRLLEEIGSDPNRVQFLRCSPTDSTEHIHGLVNDAVGCIKASAEKVLEPVLQN
jgi:coenzyme F420-reducing hydrogenase delta subunit